MTRDKDHRAVFAAGFGQRRHARTLWHKLRLSGQKSFGRVVLNQSSSRIIKCFGCYLRALREGHVRPDLRQIGLGPLAIACNPSDGTAQNSPQQGHPPRIGQSQPKANQTPHHEVLHESQRLERGFGHGLTFDGFAVPDIKPGPRDHKRADDRPLVGKLAIKRDAIERGIDDAQIGKRRNGRGFGH